MVLNVQTVNQHWVNPDKRAQTVDRFFTVSLCFYGVDLITEVKLNFEDTSGFEIWTQGCWFEH